MTLTLGLTGASDNTGNLGVTALLYAMAFELQRRVADVRLIVFDSGIGGPSGVVKCPTGPVYFERVTAKLTRKQHLSGSFDNMLWSMRVGRSTAPIARYRQCDAVLDITGGDSYSDLYGQRRFRGTRLSKAVVLASGTKLILMPQTYGPFRRPANRTTASSQVRAAVAAFARDGDSFEVLRSLLGSWFDASRHQRGVDVAFGLPAKMPDDVPAWAAEWFAGQATVVGLNISGLLAGGARSSLAVGIDYRAVILGFVRELLDSMPDVRVLLVPHVFGAAESDRAACEVAANAVDDQRVRTMPPTLDPMVAKWWIGQCQWFTGARMHSTIAALSSGCPAVAMAYSDKFAGVFDDAGQREAVVDLRSVEDDRDAVRRLLEHFDQRESAASTLQSALPVVRSRLDHQFNEIVRLAGGS